MSAVTSAVERILDGIRSKHNLPTDIALARHLDVNPTTLWRWRNGQVNPSCAKLLVAAAEQLSTPTDDQPAS